ncbi:hypothetical protein DPMN_170279 [Dreissena polymorpha]|uniref:Uncharacterized protein n=1 Tax=Dreissena polymorpha TaxID=45954 RepID=A0A9D4DVW0_DREPO|nr:hypothetical protein DPMN_170279 [Dreissena polymorpha]
MMELTHHSHIPLQPPLYSFSERSRSLSGELMRHDIGLEAPTLEKKKPGKPRRKRQTFDGADLASIVNSLDSPSPNVALQQLVGEPVSTQTEYTEQVFAETRQIKCNVLKT